MLLVTAFQWEDIELVSQLHNERNTASEAQSKGSENEFTLLTLNHSPALMLSQTFLAHLLQEGEELEAAPDWLMGF